MVQEAMAQEAKVQQVKVKQASVLIVDDSSSMRNVISHTLTQAGYIVDEAVDGVDALKMAQAHHYEAIITDINMPNMNGFDLIQKLRSKTSYKFTPILVLSTETAKDKKTYGKELKATGWLSKPFSPEKLISGMEKLLT